MAEQVFVAVTTGSEVGEVGVGILEEGQGVLGSLDLGRPVGRVSHVRRATQTVSTQSLRLEKEVLDRKEVG